MKSSDIPILMYHEIGDLDYDSDNFWCVSPENFAEQMKLLKEEGYQTISLNELEERMGENKAASENTGKKLIVITFDDGRKGVYTYTYPLLKELGFTATVYLVPKWIEEVKEVKEVKEVEGVRGVQRIEGAGRIGRVEGINEIEGKNIPPSEHYSSFMSWEEIKEISSYFEIGSHSFSHQDLTCLDEEQIKEELEKAEREIISQLGKTGKKIEKVEHFSYPFGKINPRIIKIVGEKYKTAVSVQRGFQKSKGNYARQWVTKDTSLEIFRKLLSPPAISLCMIVRNEEKHLPGCLNSVKGLADEIIIVDTGSTDRTKEIAAGFGAKVYDFPWCDDFSAARNESLKQATKDWILILDADEIIAQEDFTQIRQAVNAWEIAGFRILTRNYSYESSASGWQPVGGQSLYAKSFPGWFPSLKVRLFQNQKEFLFEGEIHEMVDQSIASQGGTIAPLPFPVHHYGAEGKSAKYLELTRKKILKNPEDAKAYFELGVQYKQLSEYALAEESFRQSVELDPSPLMPLLNLALVQQKQGKLDLARENYTKALEKNALHPEVHFGLGYCYFARNDLEKAGEHFLLAAKYNPLYLDAHINLGAVYEKQDKLAEAEVELFKALEISPDSGRTHYNLGVVYEKAMAIQPAIGCYEKAIGLSYPKGEESRKELKERVGKMRQFLTSGGNEL